MAGGTVDRFTGSMLGLALADAMGARHEGGILGALLWKAVAGNDLRWTDDTQMSIGLAESLIERGGLDADHLARRWAESYEGMRGYGPGAAKLLARIRKGENWRDANRSIFKDGSYGNGAAMRAAPLGLFYHRDPEKLREATELSSSITHAHPLGIEGGLLIARAVSLAVQDAFDLDTLRDFCEREQYRHRIDRVKKHLEGEPTRQQIRSELGNTIVAHESSVTAVYAFCRFNDFREMMDFIIDLGGDTDTIGAMAGGIFGARYGLDALPGEMVAELEQRDRIEKLARDLHASPGRP